MQMNRLIKIRVWAVAQVACRLPVNSESTVANPPLLSVGSFGKFLSRFILVLQSFLLTACVYSMSGCTSGENKKVVTPGLEADYLVLNEKILLNFFGSPDEKDWAMKTLEKRCTEETDSHACYNLATHLFSLKDFTGGMKFAEKAILLNPKDSLYMEMYRQSLIEANKLELANRTTLPISDPAYLYTKLELDCRNKKIDSALETTVELISKNILTTESIQNGFLKECLTEKMISELSQKAQRNKINFANQYYIEKNKSNLFYSIWDTSYLTKRKPIEAEEELKHKLTVYWRDFRKAVAAKNEKLARKTLNEFMKELTQEKASAKQDTNLYLAIERAAKLLIEQDDFFAKYKNLADEL